MLFDAPIDSLSVVIDVFCLVFGSVFEESTFSLDGVGMVDWTRLGLPRPLRGVEVDGVDATGGVVGS